MPYLLPDALRRSARRDPEREAFRVPGRGLSYAQADRLTDRLAAALRAQGVRFREPIGVLLPRGLESPLAVYAILKAGAAFVPLDPEAPTRRLLRLVNHLGLRRLVSAPSMAERLEQLREGGWTPDGGIGVSQGLSWEEAEQVEEPPPVLDGLTEDDLAYVMVTSGSTGEPKGIMHSHRSGLAYARLSAHTYDLVPEDRLANHSPLHFDMSTLGYLTGPWVGATTVFVPEAYARLPASLSQLIDKERVSIWYSVPFALIQLLLRGALEARSLASLRWVLFGGEPFPVKHLRQLMERLPQARFSNVYGPAEVNQCTYYHLPPADRLPDPVPIGRIWDNTEGLVEDGELLIRSATMMLGYWDADELNARAFLYRTVEGGVRQRFYRTGDLVRHDEEGHLVFAGRKDRQVKVRGYRVELDELEAALCAHPAVEEAAAFTLEGEDGERRLGAAVTLVDPQVSVDELLRFAAERLPAYAVPHSLTLADSFPRTGTGKIDRRQVQAGCRDA